MITHSETFIISLVVLSAFIAELIQFDDGTLRSCQSVE